MAKQQAKAPPGCYWRGGVLWGRQRLLGKLRRWSLATDNPAIAADRRRAATLAFDADALKRKLRRFRLSAEERDYLFHLIDAHDVRRDHARGHSDRAE
jgi:hypothetical protein